MHTVTRSHALAHYRLLAVLTGSLLLPALGQAAGIDLVDRVVAMLPEILSNNVCSLRPKEDKLCFSAVFEITDNAEVIGEFKDLVLLFCRFHFFSV